MKTFDVYQHSVLGCQVVKQGFAWPAFFFTVIWAFIKKMWGLGFAFFGVIFLLSLAQSIFEQEGSEGGVLIITLLQLAFFIFVGYKGNNWRRKNLKDRGFKHLCTVQAKNFDAAIAEIAKLDISIQIESINSYPYLAKLKTYPYLAKFCGLANFVIFGLTLLIISVMFLVKVTPEIFIGSSFLLIGLTYFILILMSAQGYRILTNSAPDILGLATSTILFGSFLLYNLDKIVIKSLNSYALERMEENKFSAIDTEYGILILLFGTTLIIIGIAGLFGMSKYKSFIKNKASEGLQEKLQP